MSRNEEESGSLVLPTSAVVAVRRALVQAENTHRSKALELAQKVHAYLSEKVPHPGSGRSTQPRLVALRKALRENVRFGPGSVESLLDQAFAAVQPRPHQAWSDAGRCSEEEQSSLRDAATQIILPYPKPNTPRTLQSPRKSALPPVPATTHAFHASTASISIDAPTRTLRWHVDRCSRAVDQARASYLGQALFQALTQVKWTRGTGGVFRSSDEYGEEAALEHGGNPVSISSHFGPLGEREFEFHHGYNPRTHKVKVRR